MDGLRRLKPAEQLLPLVYEELRKLAAAKLAQEKPGQTLQATALVHEAYLRLVDTNRIDDWKGRGHFFAAEAMRRILVDRARNKKRQKAGGMLQRASIAAALTTGPALLVADEPTTALDVTVQAEVLRQLRRLQREHGTAVLFISHDIGVVGALCDTVLVLRDGRIVDRTTGAALRAGEASHPWTAALLAARPGARRDGEAA